MVCFWTHPKENSRFFFNLNIMIKFRRIWAIFACPNITLTINLEGNSSAQKYLSIEHYKNVFTIHSYFWNWLCLTSVPYYKKKLWPQMIHISTPNMELMKYSTEEEKENWLTLLEWTCRNLELFSLSHLGFIKSRSSQAHGPTPIFYK